MLVRSGSCSSIRYRKDAAWNFDTEARTGVCARPGQATQVSRSSGSTGDLSCNYREAFP
jgi:hypothetical protein